VLNPFQGGAITHYLANDIPETAVSKRANVNPDIIEQHYDQRIAKEKMEQRRQYLDNIYLSPKPRFSPQLFEGDTLHLQWLSGPNESGQSSFERADRLMPGDQLEICFRSARN